MPYTVKWDGAGLIKKLSGFISPLEFAKSAEASTSHPDFDRAKYVINDFTEVSGADLMAAVEDVAIARIGASNGKSLLKVAYVGNGDILSRFLAELLSPQYDCGWETRMFASREDAMHWACLAELPKPGIFGMQIMQAVPPGLATP